MSQNDRGKVNTVKNDKILVFSCVSSVTVSVVISDVILAPTDCSVGVAGIKLFIASTKYQPNLLYVLKSKQQKNLACVTTIQNNTRRRLFSEELHI